MTTIPISSINIPERFRKDYGNLEELARSIKTHGLIQPPLIDRERMELVDGGRRLAAAKLLGWTEIPVYYRDSLSPTQKLLLELEANIRRKSMSWQEECLAISKMHNLALARNIQEGNTERWTYERTGQLLGISLGNVGYTLLVARELQDASSPAWKLPTFTDAIQFLARRKEDERNRVLASRLQASMPRSTPPTGEFSNLPIGSAFDDDVSTADNSPSTSRDRTIPLSKMLLHGDCRTLLPQLTSESIDHCITDPPYAIDVSMMAQDEVSMNGIERIADTHNIEENLDLLAYVIPEIYRVLKPAAFFISFCDLMNFRYLHDIANQAGFTVQRWPIIWHKTSPCMNSCAQYNSTKDYEAVLVARKGGITLPAAIPSSIFTAPNSVTKLSNPFAKSLLVWQYLIKCFTLPGQTILDPFSGEGSSLSAFVSTWRWFVGIEIEETHYNAALISLKSALDIQYRNPTYV